jgi:outer membrane protein OmpA-like peptidoglycan-associated protein
MKRILLLVFSALTLIGAQAQDLLGISSSNYGGLSSVYINPANLADNRLKFEIQLFGTGFGVANNFMGFKPSYLVRDGGLTSPNYPLLDPTPATEDFTTANFLDNRRAFVNNNIYLPSLLISINEKNSVSLSARARTYLNVDGVDGDLFRFAYNSLNYPSLYNTRITNDKLSIQTMTWMEYALGYGRVLIDQEKHFLKAGVTLKALQGLQSAYLFIDNLDYAVNSDSTLSLYNADVQYGHSTNFEANQDNANYRVVSNLGLGFDFGVIYEWRPDYAKHKHDMDGETNVWKRNENKYKLKVGVSMTDLGGVRFSKGGQSGDFTANTTNWDISKLDFGTTPIAALDDTLSARFGGTNAGADYKMNLPTAFSTQIDYHIWKDLYINQTNFIAFGFNSNANKVHDFTTISITPRWDHRIAGVSIPFSYNSLMGTRTGLAVRLGPVTFGTSSMYPYRAFLRGDGFGTKDITGLDAYVLVRIPIAYKRIKDRDADKVSDRKDQCIKVPGTWEYRGCPDRDGDHIRDEEDECPDVPGLAKLHGCPDKDDDGVTDLKDDCPDVAGVVELKGCPDKDGDGITDSKDDCPDEKGLAIFNGCPDRDSDGVMDRIDDCPDTKGLVQYNGCPDTDGDNIMDKVDECPTVYGIAELKGCPAAQLTHFNNETQIEKVTQGGGVYSYGNNIEGKTAKFKLEGYNADTVKTVFVTAPNLRGKNAYREADGFFRFAKEAEVIILKEEEKQVMKKAFENLEFKSTSDIILTSSFTSLNELAQLMAANPSWKLRISGHTDNVGNAASNMDLSKRRSESVKKYLVSKGIAADRFEVQYFGAEKPIAPNETPEGRARNRRVEMLLVE